MNTYIISIFLLLSCQLYSQDHIIKCDTITIDSILNSSYHYYLNEPVEKLLNHHYFSKYERYTFFDKTPGLLDGTYIRITKNLFLKIHVYSYQHLRRASTERNWDFNLFKKENIGKIEFFFKNDLVLTIENEP